MSFYIYIIFLPYLVAEIVMIYVNIITLKIYIVRNLLFLLSKSQLQSRYIRLTLESATAITQDNQQLSLSELSFITRMATLNMKRHKEDKF